MTPVVLLLIFVSLFACMLFFCHRSSPKSPSKNRVNTFAVAVVFLIAVTVAGCMDSVHLSAKGFGKCADYGRTGKNVDVNADLDCTGSIPQKPEAGADK